MNLCILVVYRMKRFKRTIVCIVAVFSLLLLLFSLYVRRESTAVLNDTARDDRLVCVYNLLIS